MAPLNNILFSICSRIDKIPSSLNRLLKYIKGNIGPKYNISYNQESIYKGHLNNLNALDPKVNDIVVLCHDDINILSDYENLKTYLSLCSKPNVGFVGVAGSTRFDKDIEGAWWRARETKETRGFVFQGQDPETMVPNYFGPSGQVVVLDGCFLAIKYETLKKIGLDKPSYLSSDWDFYDIHLTLKAHLEGYNNFTVPLLLSHESPGLMREGWFKTREEFLKHHYYNRNLPLKLNYARSSSVPIHP